MFNSIKNFYNSLSLIDKDNFYNFFFSLFFGFILSFAYDLKFLSICILIFSSAYILQTLWYFREYLTNKNKYNITINNEYESLIENFNLEVKPPTPEDPSYDIKPNVSFDESDKEKHYGK